MQAVRQRDTPKEIAIRRDLYAVGLRYRVDFRLCKAVNCRADIVFTKARVAIFIDGCFWHGCPKHGTLPKTTNRLFWQSKIAANRQRDRKIKKQLQAAGWTVLRFWEHDSIVDVRTAVLAAVRD